MTLYDTDLISEVSSVERTLEPGETIAALWTRSWQEMLKDPLSRSGRGTKGPDQELLTKWVWPWGRLLALEHDSNKYVILLNLIHIS